MGVIYNLFDVVGRILIAAMFLQSGMSKIGSYAATSHYMVAKGVPSVLLPLVIIVEVAGSITIILGWKIRLFALALHLGGPPVPLELRRPDPSVTFMKDISIAGGFLIIFAHGAGGLSLDTRRGKPRRR
jgi:putative oxidoreductase